MMRILALLICLNIILGINALIKIHKLNEKVFAEETDGVTVFAGAENGAETGNESFANDSLNVTAYAKEVWSGSVDKPQKREKNEILSHLKELTATYPQITAIYENADAYPENMLEALANNPEMASYVAGYLNREQLAEQGLTQEEKNMKYPLFLQWDPRWGYESYGDDSYVGLAGCGPVSLAMALTYLTEQEDVTPDVIADYAMKNGYYMYGTGTMWSLMEDVPIRYGIHSKQTEITEENMKNVLDENGILICAMRQGDFTATGHFIVLFGYDEGGFFINDPNCVERSMKTWEFSTIKNQIKQMWALHS